jgi:N-acyl amino acid synthase of PEP-CTERM/exosortase system
MDMYDRFFEVRRARTPADRALAHRVRYQVYCLESGFFPPENYPDGEEIDAFDEHSVQSLVIYKPTETAVGTARLILPDPATGDALGSFPFDELCDASPLYEQKILPRDATAEISRFCLARALRAEIVRTVASRAGAPLSEREIGLLAKPALIRAVVEMSLAEGITHWCAVMEPWLIRALQQLGVVLEPFGPPVQHHGERQPCYREMAQVLAGIRRERADVWDIVTNRGRLCP